MSTLTITNYCRSCGKAIPSAIGVHFCSEACEDRFDFDWSDSCIGHDWDPPYRGEPSPDPVGHDWDPPRQGEPNPDPVGHVWPPGAEGMLKPIPRRHVPTRSDAFHSIKNRPPTDPRCKERAKELDTLIAIAPNYPRCTLNMGHTMDPDGTSAYRWWIAKLDGNRIDLHWVEGRMYPNDGTTQTVPTYQWVCDQRRCPTRDRNVFATDCYALGYACEARHIDAAMTIALRKVREW
jgi:hypothetical protein